MSQKITWIPVSTPADLPESSEQMVYLKIWRKAKNDEKIIRTCLKNVWAGVNILAWKPVTYYDIVREVFPDSTDDYAEYLLWNHTPYPHNENPADLIKALKVSKATWDAGKEPCVWCGKPTRDGKIDCKKCSDAISAASKG